VQVSLTFKVINKDPDAADLMAAFGDDWNQAAQDAHEIWVMRVLEYIVRFSRVDTGRSRAGWFNFMDLRGYNYRRSLPPTGTEEGTDEGRALGDSISEPFITTIINNVNYVEPMNRRYGLFGFAPATSGKMKLGSSDGIRFEEKIPVFEQYGADNWQKFIENAREAFEAGGGRKFKPGPIAPVTNEPPLNL
jgi:hypothetical protein